MKSLKKNAILNSIRQVCSVIFPLITFPYVSRVLGMENYGKISFAQSVVSYFSLIAALGIVNYAVREGAGCRDNKSEFNIFANEVFTINVISMTVSYLLLGIAVVISAKLHNYSMLIAIQSASLLFSTIGVEWLYTIYEDYLYITIRGIIVQIMSLVLMFIFVRKPEDYVTYAAITVFSSGGANIFNFLRSRKYTFLRLTRRPNLKIHLKPMLVLFFNMLMVSVYVNSDITMIGFFRTDKEVGAYTAAVKIYTIVKGILNSVIIVAIPRLSFYLQNSVSNKYNELLSNVIGYTSVILCPAIVGIFCESDNIISIIAGKQYIGGTIPLKILSCALLFSIYAGLLTSLVLLPAKKDRQILIMSSVSAFVNVILNLLLIPLMGITGAALTTLVAESVVFCFGIKFSRNIASFKINIKDGLTIICGCLSIVLFCNMMNLFHINIYLKEIITVLGAVLLYFIIQIVMKNKYVLSILHDILKR